MTKPRPQYRRTFTREWRKHRKMTLEQLAERVGMTAGGLSYFERGWRGYTQESLESIATALNVTTAQLLSRPPRPDDELEEELASLPPDERRRVLAAVRALRS